ncbi:MAG TPA: trigger factor, partial [Acidimicrobiales bacterium]|nr:trigger factor [Acidimicrobiales bacterium]
PGFRPGKAPRRVIEARIGRDAARQEALKDAVPEYYSQALRENDVDAIAPPEIDITSDGEQGAVTFDAVVEVRPTVSIAGYAGLQVTVPNLSVSDEDVDAQVDRLRDTFAELRAVNRPAHDSDHVTIDISGYRHEQRFDDLSADDFLYEVGSGSIVPELDDNLRGARVGDILKFNAETPQQGEASFQVLVKEVKEKVLPEVTDEWASEASEFSTVDELRADIRSRVETVRLLQARMALRDVALQALVGLVTDEPPEALVNSEYERRVHDLGHRLEAQKIDLAQYLAATGRSQEELVAELRAGSVEAVKADLALRALVEAEAIEASDDDVDAQLGRMAERYGVAAPELRREIERGDRLESLRADIRQTMALDWLIDHVEVLDEDGNPVDRALLDEPPPALGAAAVEALDVDGPDVDGPDVEGPDVEGPDVEGPDVEGMESPETAEVAP